MPINLAALKALFEAVLEKYQSAEESVIYERSSAFDTDLDALAAEVEDYKHLWALHSRED